MERRDDYIVTAYRYLLFTYAGFRASRPFGGRDIAAESVFWLDGDWLGGDAGLGFGVASAVLGSSAAGILSVSGVAVGILARAIHLDTSYFVGGLGECGSCCRTNAHHTTPPASWRGPRLSDDKTVAKMGHPVCVA
jgi:hypothetical protein